MYKHILLPTDGSDLAQNGVEHGLALAKALGSRVTVITVTEPFPIIYGRTWDPGPVEAKRFEEENTSAASAIFAKARSAADKIGVSFETLHVANQSSAGTAIVEACPELGCDLIVMSSQGRTGLSRMLLGSQTSKVLTQSSVPVLVVR